MLSEWPNEYHILQPGFLALFLYLENDFRIDWVLELPEWRQFQHVLNEILYYYTGMVEPIALSSPLASQLDPSLARPAFSALIMSLTNLLLSPHPIQLHDSLI